MSSSNPPASIQELADRAEKDGIWEASKDFKVWLKAAERARHAGQEYDQSHDLENAFVQFALAATLILDKVPSHREYYTRLDAAQRHTLTTKGKAILDRMGELKPVLTDRHNKWDANQPTSSTQTRSAEPSSSSSRSSENKLRKPSRQGSSRANLQLSGTQIWYPDVSVVAHELRRKDDTSAAKAFNEQRTRTEQAGIIQRQREADEQAQAARQHFPEHYSFEPQPPVFRAGLPLSNSSSHSSYNPPPLLPLESPVRSYGQAQDLDNDLYKRVNALTLSRQQASSPFGLPPQPPITTTSEPPVAIDVIQYPQIMSQHQRTQGYAPSLQSMFQYPTVPPQASLLFADQVEIAPPTSMLYSNILPTPSYPSVVTTGDRNQSQSAARPYMFGPRDRPGTPSEHANGRSHSPRLAPSPSQDPRPPPVNSVAAPRIAPASSSEKKELSTTDLKTVQFPRDVLPRFLSIASLNTAKNRETCGLLLGKLKNDNYIVTTLLIPRQHSTSDTCSMDEEELVLAFSEKRSLMTLGWIHTHPTQSCFMSSVDLHTHSGFQCMLPEAFAVVCAPQHKPNFGIFRLTDPPGLRTVLECKKKEVFHPHPDLPIYTDADKGHVQMNDKAIEIVDIR